MHLSTNQQKRFTTVFDALLGFVNARLHVITRTEEDFAIDKQIRAELIAREVWKCPKLIDDFVAENPAQLAASELAIARDLHSFICDDFIYEGERGGQGVFAHETGVYLTCGFDDSTFGRLPSIPSSLRAVLVPFEGLILAVMPITALGEASDELRRQMEARRKRHGTQEPTADGAVLARRATAWQRKRLERQRTTSAPAPQEPAAGYHVGALAGLSGHARTRAKDAHYDLIAHESGLHQLLMEARSISTTIFPISLRECLDVLDEDWLTSVAEHLDALPHSSDIPREELIELICTRLTTDRQQRDEALMWCEDAQFDLLRRLMRTNPISFTHMPPSLALKLYPMIPYVFILCEKDSFVAWMPPEVQTLMREVDFENVAHARRRLDEAAHAADALASMCGVLSVDAAYERYRAVAADPFDREHFELALIEMERCDTRDSYALWTHDDTKLVISAELSDESALARIVRWSYADRIIRPPEGMDVHTPTLVDMTGADEEEFDERLDLELTHLDAERRVLVEQQRDLSPHALKPQMLSQDFVDYLVETTPLREVRAYVDRHIPDDQDDYEFADTFARALVVSALFEHEPYDDVLDVVRLFGMHHCEGEGYPHTLGRLVTDVFNMLPRWDLNGWSLAENTARVTGRPPTPASPLVAEALKKAS